MSRFSPEYLTISKYLHAAHSDLFQEWSKDNSNPELMEASKMLIDAAKEAGR